MQTAADGNRIVVGAPRPTGDPQRDMDTTENPSFAAAPDTQPSGGRADLEAAVASLHASFKDGNEAETVETLESLMIAREAELQADLL